MIPADVVARWHLDLAAVALAVGCAVAMIGVRRWWASLSLPIAGLVGAVLGGLPPLGQVSWRSWIWVGASVVVLLFGLAPGFLAGFPARDAVQVPFRPPARSPVRDAARSPARDALTHPLGDAAVPLALLSLMGVWSAVPDTEPPVAAGCVLVPTVVMAMVMRLVMRPTRATPTRPTPTRPTPTRPTPTRITPSRTTPTRITESGDPGQSTESERIVLHADSRWMMDRVGPVGTAALVVMIAGAAWVGSAGWGSAMATVFVVGMVLVAPLILGFRRVSDATSDYQLTGYQQQTLVTMHALVALVLPRSIMSRSVPVATTVAVAAVCVMMLAALMIKRQQRNASHTNTPGA